MSTNPPSHPITPMENHQKIKQLAAKLYGAHMLVSNYNDVIITGNAKEFHSRGIAEASDLIEKTILQLRNLGAIVSTGIDALSQKTPIVSIVADGGATEKISYDSGILHRERMHDTFAR